MLRDEYSKQLIVCKWLKEACRNIGKDYAEDLEQEFWILFLSISEQKLAQIRDIRFFCVRILININAERFRKKRVRTVSLEVSKEPHQSDYDPTTDRLHSLKNAIINRLPFYERVLFKLVESGKSYRDIERETKISRIEIAKTINRIKIILKNAETYI